MLKRASINRFVFGIPVLATLIAAPAAHAVCKSQKIYVNTLMTVCTRTSGTQDAHDIREGVRTRNGKMVGAGAQACALDLDRKKQWDDWARGCSDGEFVVIARTEMELGKVCCDRYSQ